MRGYTVEMSFLMPIIMLLVMSSIYAFFYYHDKNIIAGAAYETAVVGSNKAREKTGSQTGTGDKSGTDAAELETLFQSRVNGKCILLSTIQGQVTVEGDEVCVRAQLFYPCDLTQVFGQVRLYRKVESALYFSQLFHKLIRTGRSKTRRQDRFDVGVKV